MNWKPEDMRRILMNPLYAITVSPAFSTPHPPMVTKDQWVSVNANMIKEMGAERWLRALLDILESGGVESGKSSQQ